MTVLVFLTLLAGDSPFFQGSLEEAIAKARREGKPLIVDFYTDWCGPCNRMDRTTFANDKVRDAMTERVVAVKINAEKGEGTQVAQGFKITGYPSFLLLDNRGEEVARRMGYMDARRFLSWLDGTLDGQLVSASE